MKNIMKSLKLPLLVMAVFLSACKKEVETGILNKSNFSDTNTPLKEAADFPIGVAIDFNPMMNNQQYREVAQRDFDGVTFSYHMKHGAIVRDDGTMNFANTDALVQACGNLEIFGHTLGWHQNQNASYLKNFSGIVIPAAVNLIQNGGFELGGATNFNNWSVFNSGNPAGSATITVGTGNEVRTGTRSMKVTNPTAYPGNQWRVQVASDFIPTVAGRQYTISYWVRALSAGGSIRLSTQTSGGGEPQYQGDQTIGTAWQQVSWTITANSPQTRVLFDMGQASNTYFIDDVSFSEAIIAPSGGQITARLDQALNSFITQIVTRYKNKVKAWDVVNELFTEDGNIRNNNNTSTTPTDVLVWSHYLGRDYALKAFNYARAADPNADLYINDYNLESSPRKLDSLIAFVGELKRKGAKVDGIGTQMHIFWNSSHAGIDAMFQKLAATGLKIRVSELDVRINPTNKGSFIFDKYMEGYQAQMYNYVVKSYIKHVPPAQRAGITIWGISDNTSWLYNNGRDFPLLYRADFSKKQAYGGVLDGLQKK
jgi:endo-1,4-beta-xylanase